MILISFLESPTYTKPLWDPDQERLPHQAHTVGAQCLSLHAYVFIRTSINLRPVFAAYRYAFYGATANMGVVLPVEKNINEIALLK